MTTPAGELLEKVAQATKDQSTIQFPYVHFEDALSVARTIHEVGGVPVTRDQLLAAMKEKGNFAAKFSAARMFGLIESAAGKFQLTQLAYAALDSDETRQRTARASAFLNVPLYQRTYSEFRGKQLPPRPYGLESAFVGFGVAPKQKANARMAFDRSARQCGFYSNDQQDRLVEPIIANAVPAGGAAESENSENRATYSATVHAPPHPDGTVGSNFTAKLLVEPLIRGMVERLPPVGSKWEIEKRRRWLQTFASNLELVYETDESDGGKVIAVEIKGGNDRSA